MPIKYRKLLYLLQLEEYETERFFAWLMKNKINLLEERKGKLTTTFRVSVTYLISRITGIFLTEEKSVGLANEIVNPFFAILEEVIVVLAQFKLLMFPSLIRIVITGSYGKTTFKEILTSVLESKYSVLKTPGNINTGIGIALLVLRKLGGRTKIMISEAGAYKRGEIKKICQLVRPGFGVITIFGLMHLERFGTFENLKKTKMELGEFVEKEKLFLPSKDQEFIDFTKTVVEICKQLGVDRETTEAKLRDFSPPEHRLVEFPVKSGLKMIDDSYNSNPLGFKRAINCFKNYPGYQKIIVTPGMIELGDRQDEQNSLLAKKAAEVVDIFVIVGRTNRNSLIKGVKMARRKTKLIEVDHFQDYEHAVSRFLKLPAVILLENDLPDNYF